MCIVCGEFAWFVLLERLSDSNIRDCTESKFGCCQDHVMFAPGPNYAGCPGNISYLKRSFEFLPRKSKNAVVKQIATLNFFVEINFYNVGVVK